MLKIIIRIYIKINNFVMDKYNILETIGDGTYGTVYKAINTLNSIKINNIR